VLLLFPTAAEARALLDGRAPEAEVPCVSRVGEREVLAALCGFGPAAAGALGALALAAARPGRCVLAGIAGTLEPAELPVGAVIAAAEVRTADVGRGGPDGVVGPGRLGFPQAPGGAGLPTVVDRLTLDPPALPGVRHGLLLTVACAAGTPEAAAARRAAHPGALAEDMEGFPVALAASRLGIPAVVLRAVSNVAGEADRDAWEIPRALTALRGALGALVAACEVP
jgi:futalosine hydrolase